MFELDARLRSNENNCRTFHKNFNFGTPGSSGVQRGGGGQRGQFAPGPRLKRGPKIKIRRHPMQEIQKV